MIKILVENVEYKLCEKCGTHRKPEAFQMKGRKRKSCSCCRNKK